MRVSAIPSKADSADRWVTIPWLRPDIFQLKERAQLLQPFRPARQGRLAEPAENQAMASVRHRDSGGLRSTARGKNRRTASISVVAPAIMMDKSVSHVEASRCACTVISRRDPLVPLQVASAMRPAPCSPSHKSSVIPCHIAAIVGS